jgi:hypothetical protein
MQQIFEEMSLDLSDALPLDALPTLGDSPEEQLNDDKRVVSLLGP